MRKVRATGCELLAVVAEGTMDSVLVIDLTHPLMPVLVIGLIGCAIGVGFIVLIRVVTGEKPRRR